MTLKPRAAEAAHNLREVSGLCWRRNCSAVISPTTTRWQAGVVFRRKVDPMIHAALIALLLISQTRVVQLHDTEIVRRSNFVIAATVDGFVCYGTKEPLAVRCHRAVRFKEVPELSASGSGVSSVSERNYYAAAAGYGRSILLVENTRLK